MPRIGVFPSSLPRLLAELHGNGCTLTSLPPFLSFSSSPPSSLTFRRPMQGYRCERCGLDAHRECQLQVMRFRPCFTPPPSLSFPHDLPPRPAAFSFLTAFSLVPAGDHPKTLPWLGQCDGGRRDRGKGGGRDGRGDVSLFLRVLHACPRERRSKWRRDCIGKGWWPSSYRKIRSRKRHPCREHGQAFSILWPDFIHTNHPPSSHPSSAVVVAFSLCIQGHGRREGKRGRRGARGRQR